MQECTNGGMAVFTCSRNVDLRCAWVQGRCTNPGFDARFDVAAGDAGAEGRDAPVRNQRDRCTGRPGCQLTVSPSVTQSQVARPGPCAACAAYLRDLPEGAGDGDGAGGGELSCARARVKTESQSPDDEGGLATPLGWAKFGTAHEVSDEILATDVRPPYRHWYLRRWRPRWGR